MADQKPTAAEKRDEKRHALIDRWFQETFSGSLLAQNTAVYNEVRAGVEDLKKRLDDA